MKPSRSLSPSVRTLSWSSLSWFNMSVWYYWTIHKAHWFTNKTWQIMICSHQLKQPTLRLRRRPRSYKGSEKGVLTAWGSLLHTTWHWHPLQSYTIFVSVWQWTPTPGQMLMPRTVSILILPPICFLCWSHFKINCQRCEKHWFWSNSSFLTHNTVVCK